MHFLPPALPTICTSCHLHFLPFAHLPAARISCRVHTMPFASPATCTMPFAPLHLCFSRHACPAPHAPAICACHLHPSPATCISCYAPLPFAPCPLPCVHLMIPPTSYAPCCSRPACCQLRRANSSRDAWPSSRRYRACSSSPSWGDPPRRRPRSRSPYQDREPGSDRLDKHSRDSARRPKRVKSEFFQPSAGSHGGVCAACLGRHKHNFSKCEEPRLWDGSASSSRKNEHGRLVAANGLPLCFDWQVPRGCASSSHPERHRCTGCGRADHGAQGCPRAEKA